LKIADVKNTKKLKILLNEMGKLLWCHTETVYK
jgi:hypothetical protein